MKIKNMILTHYKILFVITAILVIVGVLFIKPEVGVADQGDFDRIMNISGLSLLDSDINNQNFVRFYDYIVPEYKINKIDKISESFKGCSLSYLIIFINTICKQFGQNVFKTQYLAIAYSILYIIVFTVILKFLNIKDNVKLMIVSSSIIFIFFDGNYLIWFNSLYGEPMMIITFSMFIAAVLNYIHYKFIVKKTKYIMIQILLILLAAFLFLGSKLQVSTSLPFIVFLAMKILLDNRQFLHKTSFAILCIVTYMLIIYPVGICKNSSNLSKDTQYNSVFFGVLNGSKTPKQDLIDLGLNPDMYVEAGKHSYLDSKEYVKYIPGDQITYDEFYDKINNLKLAKFYLTHPIRLLKGMEYTAEKALYTSTSLGKCTQSYSKTPIGKFNRLTVWSYIRENILPKNLYFITFIYMVIFLISIYKYINSRYDFEIRNTILLLWTIMLIGAVQFPMPFVGNGMADTAKQLFLFNFIFDVLLIFILNCISFKIIDLIKNINKYK